MSPTINHALHPVAFGNSGMLLFIRSGFFGKTPPAQRMLPVSGQFVQGLIDITFRN